MSLERNIRRYERLKRLLPVLEAKIKADAAPIFYAQGCRATPRIERIIAHFRG